MSNIPREPHVKVKEPNTDLQERIIQAVEEHYPEKTLREISDLDEVDCHPSTVTKTVKDFMAPKGEGGGPEKETPPEAPPIDLSIGPSEMTEDVESYVDGYTDGFEAGFYAGLEWVEEHGDSSET